MAASEQKRPRSRLVKAGIGVAALLAVAFAGVVVARHVAPAPSSEIHAFGGGGSFGRLPSQAYTGDRFNPTGLPPVVSGGFGQVGLPAGAAPATKPVTGVMIAGQSNAHGRANPTLLDPGVNGTAVYSLATIDTADSLAWPATPSVVPRRDLQPFGSGVPGMGVELSLGRFLVQSGLADSVLPMSKLGVDGTAIATWRNSTNLANFNAYWSAQEVGQRVISDLIWIQGEADAVNSTLSGLYESELTALMTSIRAAHPGLKRIFIIRLNNAATGASIISSDRAAVRTAQANWVAANPGVGYLVNVDGVSLDPADNVHYLANGYWGMGHVIGQAMLQAIGVEIVAESSGVYVRQFRGAMHYSSTASASITVTPTPANVGDRQYMVCDANALSLAISLTAAEGFTQIGSTLDSNASGVHVMFAAYERTYNGSQGSPIVDTTATQQRRGCFIFTVDNSGNVDASTTSVTNLNTTTVTMPSVTTTADNSLAVYLYGGYSATDSTLSSLACASLPDEVLLQESRISNGSKIALVAGHLAAHGASGTCTATASVNTNQARMTLSIPPS
jgi:carbohydrate esterase-like sialic acid-specific acetylesterase